MMMHHAGEQPGGWQKGREPGAMEAITVAQ
jgi:hypothetical protein